MFYALTGIRRQVELKKRASPGSELAPVGPSPWRPDFALDDMVGEEMAGDAAGAAASGARGCEGTRGRRRRGRHRATEAAGIKAVEGICRGARQRPWRHMWATPLGAKVTWASNPSGSSPMDPPRESSLFRQSFREGDEASCPRVDKMWFRLAAFTCRWMRRDKSKGIKRKKK